MSIAAEPASVSHTDHRRHRHRPSNVTTHVARHGGNADSFVEFDAVVASLCVILLAFIVWLSCYMYRKRMPRPSGAVEENSYHKCGATWTFAEVDVATEGFSARRLLGRGRYGSTYRAIFADGRVLAVKRIDPGHVLLKAGSNCAFGFSAEIKALSRARHPNVVPVLGYCEAPAERIIVMEFMARRSLQYHLHRGGIVFDWSHRLRIVAQAAQGIEYLHEGTAPAIIHGDIRPSNILLDSTWSARVADFGLSFLAPLNQMFGTVGYLDPEYYTRLDLCKPSDIYSFGVVLLEILSGKPCFADDFGEEPMNSDSTYIVDWAVPLIASSRAPEVFDRRLEVPSNPRPLIRTARLAALCVSNLRKNRPTILEVVAVLKSIEMELIATAYVNPAEGSDNNRRGPVSATLPFRSQF